MNERIPADLITPDQPFFLDLVAGRPDALDLVSRPLDAFAEAAKDGLARPVQREALANALRDYNEGLGASRQALRAIDRLAEEGTLCVLGGQQAGFLGGPLYTAYKIVSVLRVAAHAEALLGTPVVPIFWLATEDHDFTEINRARFLEPDGSLRTVAFEWEGRGKPIEDLPLTPEILQALEEALPASSELPESTRAFFQPEEGDDYSRWHARIWSRLFAEEGLVLVEPRILRGLTGPFFHEVLANAPRIHEALVAGRDRLASASYDPPFDPNRVGVPFHRGPTGERIRIEAPQDHADDALTAPGRYSTDAALRPLLADRLFPSIAHVLGPTEIAYHTMLAPLYDALDTPQPVLVPRGGFTLLSEDEANLLDRLGLPIPDAIAGEISSKEALRGAASSGLQGAFRAARSDASDAVERLRPTVDAIDPGLGARLRQTSDHVAGAFDRLEERAIRADLARQGISAAGLHALLASLRPTGRPQERVLSFAHAALRFGVEWVKRLPCADEPHRFAHFAVTIKGGE